MAIDGTGSTSRSTITRRKALGLGLGALAAGPVLSACGGASTSGAGGEGSVNFISTQFTPIEERQRFEAILKKFVGDIPVAFNPLEPGQFTSTLQSQVQAKNVQVSLAGGLHGDVAPVADLVVAVDDLMGELSSAGYSPDLLELAKLGSQQTKYVPWMQATYVLAVNKKALAWLPAGADVQKLTYDQFLDWAVAARKANGGKPVFGFPAGPKGLHHRFYQGYLLPSFTGGQITSFSSAQAVTAWQYMKDLWANMAPASTNFDFMQEPLARGEVLVAWDHVARLTGAPANKPNEWVMAPAPKGPMGLGYLLVVAGLAMPSGGLAADQAKQVIRALTKPEAQVEVLRQNAFFPVVKTELPADLPPAIKLQASAVKAQQNSPDAILALPPVGLGEKDGEVSEIFKNCFKQICLSKKPIPGVLAAQAKQLQTIISEAKAPCWKPDPESSGQVCQVG